MISLQVFDRCFVRSVLLAAFSLTTLQVTSTAQILPGGPAETIFTSPQNVSNDPGNSWNHQMVVDHQGNLDLTWWDNSPGYGAFFFRRSTDGGLTFSNPQNLSNDPAGTGPANMAVDSAGNIYLVWATATGAFFSRSSDGTNFSAPVQIIDYSATPSIAVGSNGNIYVGWADGTQYHNVFFSQSNDGGATFSSPVLLSTVIPFGGTPLIAIDSSGNIDVVWEGCIDYCQIWFSRSSDGGATFSAQYEIQGVLEARSAVSMGVGPGGDINVVFNTVPFGNVFLARSTDGASFTKTNVSNNINVPHYITPARGAIAIEPDDKIDVVWDDGGTIFFGRSTDEGATFTSQTIPNGTTGNFSPRIILDSSSNINVVWIGSTSSYDIFFSRSTDNGTTFSPAQKLSNNTGNSSPDPQIVLDTLGNAYVTWIDYSPGNPDVFFTRDLVQVPPALPNIPSLP